MDKKMYELKINETLSHLMPPLSAEEESLLTESLLDNGCREPLVVWNGSLVDGHARYRICWRHGIPFTYVEMKFESENDAVLWSIRNQIGRRNLTPFQRCELVLPYEDALKAEAKKRQGWRSDLRGSDSSFGRRTAYVLADMAGVSHDTFYKAKAVLEKADDKTITRAREGSISISRAYLSVAKKPEKAKPNNATYSGQLVTPDIVSGVEYKASRSGVKTSTDILKPIGDAVRSLLDRVSEGEVTTKMIIAELSRVAEMIDEASEG